MNKKKKRGSGTSAKAPICPIKASGKGIVGTLIKKTKKRGNGAMQKFVKQYNGKTIEDAGAYQSEEFKSLGRRFKNALKREFPDFEIEKYTVGHYSLSGFLEKEGVHIYFAWEVPRQGMPINPHESGCMYGMLYRTALDASDFCGGPNHFCSIKNFGESVRILYEKEKVFRNKSDERENKEELSI